MSIVPYSAGLIFIFGVFGRGGEGERWRGKWGGAACLGSKSGYAGGVFLGGVGDNFFDFERGFLLVGPGYRR